MKKVGLLLLTLVFVFVLTVCNVLPVDIAFSEEHTVISGDLTGTALLISNDYPGLSIKHLYIDGIPVYEVHPQSEKSLPMVMFFHGHGGNKNNFLAFAVTFALDGYFCILPDLTGYGERIMKEPMQSLEAAVNATADIDTLLDYYQTEYLADTDHFALIGFSLGGSAVWHYLAYGQRVPAAIVSGISTADFSVVKNYGAVQDGIICEPTMDAEEFREYALQHNPLSVTEKFSFVPMLVFHGKKDPLIPYEWTKKLQTLVESLKNDKAVFLYFEETGHEITDELLQSIKPFVDTYLKSDLT